MKGVMRPGLIAGSICFIASVLLLHLGYPWEVYSKFAFPRSETLLSYILLALIVAVIVGPLSRLVLGYLWRAARGRVASAVLIALVNLALLLGLVLLFSGPGLALELPGTRIQGIFFAEWKFLTFYFYVAVPVALISGAVGAFLPPRSTPNS